jgi:hypothetical protein
MQNVCCHKAKAQARDACACQQACGRLAQKQPALAEVPTGKGHPLRAGQGSPRRPPALPSSAPAHQSTTSPALTLPLWSAALGSLLAASSRVLWRFCTTTNVMGGL